MRFARSAISLLDADPDLGAELSARQFNAARKELFVRVGRLEPGARPAAKELLGIEEGLLLIEGVILRDLTLAGCPSAELIGPADVLEPSGLGQRDTLVPVEVMLTVIEPAVIAILDRPFRLLAGRWPPVLIALLERVEQRAARLAKQAAICHLGCVRARLLAILWHLADRWGRVGPEYVILPLQLLHRTLGRLVGAERPTVSLALKALADDGLVERRRDGAWLLRGDPIDELGALIRPAERMPAAVVADPAMGEFVRRHALPERVHS